MHNKLRFLYAVATSCLQSPAPAVKTSLECISNTTQSSSFSALVMCYDVAQSYRSLGDNPSIESKKSKHEPVYKPEQDSFLVLSQKHSKASNGGNIPDFYPGLSVNVTAAPILASKMFRPDPKTAPVLRASKVACTRNRMYLLALFLILA